MNGILLELRQNTRSKHFGKLDAGMVDFAIWLLSQPGNCVPDSFVCGAKGMKLLSAITQ